MGDSQPKRQLAATHQDVEQLAASSSVLRRAGRQRTDRKGDCLYRFKAPYKGAITRQPVGVRMMSLRGIPADIFAAMQAL